MYSCRFDDEHIGMDNLRFQRFSLSVDLFFSLVFKFRVMYLQVGSAVKRKALPIVVFGAIFFEVKNTKVKQKHHVS